LFAGAFPRLGSILLWLARPNLFTQAFGGSWFIPVLGIIFLPFTTLMYVILWRSPMGITGFDWFWLVLAVVLDLMHWSSTTYYNRNRIPGYNATSGTGNL
jgi:hypothetical protein